MEPPDTKYARSGELHLAYQRYGSGPDLVLIPPLVSNVELGWEHEVYRRAMEYIGHHTTVLQFDKRGIGCSDRFERLPTLDERIEDIAAVMDAEGIERASVLGLSEGGLMAQLFAVRHPKRVDRLELLNSGVGYSALSEALEYVHAADPPFDLADTLQRFRQLVETWGHRPEFIVDWMMPSQAGNASFVRWCGRLERQSASPADIERQITSVLSLEQPDVGAITAPTLVLNVTGDRVVPPTFGRYLADRIPNASYLEFPGEDHFLWVMPNWRHIADAWLCHVLGTLTSAGTERRFATVLFTDIVGSTAASAAVGDSSWRDMLDSHDRICRQIVDRHHGRIVKSTGDGLLATFEAPSLAVVAAAALVRELASIDFTIRAGLHAGEIEFREDGDVSGAAVNLAARVEETAEPGHVFVSSTVRDLVLGGDHRFVERGEFTLKGFEGAWRLYALNA